MERSRTYGRQLVRGIARYSRMYGPWSFYRQPLFYLRQSRRRDQLAHLKKWKPTGVITRDSEDLEKFSSLQVPIIVSAAVKKPDFRYSLILTNDNAIGRMGAEHLIERGFRNFAYCGYKNMFWSQKRADAFQQMVNEAGFVSHIYKYHKLKSISDWEQELVSLVDWLTSLPKPIGIMACNDDRAQEIAEASNTAGFKLPFDIAVLGVDNDDQVCEISNPPLSSIALDIEPVGYRAAKLLDKMMSGEKLSAQKLVVEPSRVVMRQSTDVVAVSDPLVSQAVRFIRDNSKKLIQVEDVLQAVGASRRNLHDRFIKSLDRSVHEEIKRTRINAIIQLMLETDMTISQIAYELGYSSADHIGRYFKQATGVTPAAYRKRHAFT